MKLPEVVSRHEWNAQRRALLELEKGATHARDVLNAARRALPMVRLDKDYVFEGAEGRRSLLELFDGQHQLIVCHIMFHRERGEACVGCSFAVDNLPHLAHIRARDTALVLVSRAPYPELAAFKARMGWNAPWYSSEGSDFNYDFHATTDEAVAPVEYNYRDKATLEQLRQVYHVKGEQPGVSVFLRDAEALYHTYSTYGRGLELMQTTYNYLDLTAFGRGEGWGGMPSVGADGRNWLRHHDKYDE
ncbi:MAG TPA: DUF899 domain-containing protein [Polyangiales bacterium]|nr:DUF899 domain-containing protein [Polyangiales bacterium]